MRSTLEDCFRELIRDKISDWLEENIKNLSDFMFDEFVENPYSFNDYVDQMELYDIFYTDVECFNTINNDVRLFQEMIEYIRKEDDDYVYNSNVVDLFITFIDYWKRDQIMGEDGIFVDMISEALETEATERDRQKEIKRLMPLVINRSSIPNELTQNIMLMVGERC